MITVVIESNGNAEALARTIAALVPGVVAGVLGSCVVLNPSGDAETRTIADAAGAICLESGRAADAVAAADTGWLLIIEPGARPHGDWIDALRAHVAEGSGPARFSDGRRSANPLLALFRRPRGLATGLLVTRSQAETYAGATDSLAGFARGRSIRFLDAQMIPAAR